MWGGIGGTPLADKIRCVAFDSFPKQLNKVLILVRCRRTKDNGCPEVLMVMMKMRMTMAPTEAGGYTQVQRGVPISLSESCDSSHLVIW